MPTNIKVLKGLQASQSSRRHILPPMPESKPHDKTSYNANTDIYDQITGTLKSFSQNQLMAIPQNETPTPELSSWVEKMVTIQKLNEHRKKIKALIHESRDLGRCTSNSPMGTITSAVEVSQMIYIAAKAAGEDHETASEYTHQMEQGLLRGAMLGAARSSADAFKQMDTKITPYINFTSRDTPNKKDAEMTYLKDLLNEAKSSQDQSHVPIIEKALHKLCAATG